jgi:O-antigen/teichoic acid export membrane protein
MKVITNALWLSICRITADILSFVLFAAISRAFGPAGAGEYSYAFAIGTLVALISTSGFEDYGIREYARSAAADRALLWQQLLSTQSAQLVLGALTLGAFVVAGLVRSSNVLVVLELSVYVIGWSISRTFFIPAMAAQSMMRPALTDLTCRLAAILCALGLALAVRPPLPWLLVPFPIAGVTLAALALRNSVRMGAKPRLRRDWRAVAETLRGTLPFAGSDVLNQFYARADVLLIAYFLGNAQVGLYATDIKFVEVGLLPLILLGTAAYPLLSSYAAHEAAKFEPAARDFIRVIFFLGGWLAVGVYWLIPLLIVPTFGDKFAASVALLPYIAAFSLLKGAEAAFYRVLYSMHRQNWYLISLLVGTVIIWVLNYSLIPSFGLVGAVVAAIISTVVVDIIAAAGVAGRVKGSYLAMAAAQLLLALAVTKLIAAGLEQIGAGPRIIALLAAVAFPLMGAAAGLLPHPRRSLLLRRTVVDAQPHGEAQPRN